MYVIYTHSRAYTYTYIHVNIDTCIHTIRPYTTNPKLNKVQIHGYGFTCVCVCACVSVCSACLEDAESKSQLSLPKNTTRDSLS